MMTPEGEKNHDRLLDAVNGNSGYALMDCAEELSNLQSLLELTRQQRDEVRAEVDRLRAEREKIATDINAARGFIGHLICIGYFRGTLRYANRALEIVDWLSKWDGGE
jgi:hypothetical protein